LAGTGVVKDGSGVVVDRDDLEEFLSALRAERGLADNTVAAYRRDLLDYLGFVGEVAIKPDTVGDFVADLSRRGLATTTVARRVAAIRSFHRFLLDEGRTQADPTVLIRTPKRPDAVPKALDVQEAIALVEAPDLSTVAGRRDRAMLEVLYGTGCRVSELLGLDLGDLDLEDGVARVIGKGDRERTVPLGRQAVMTIRDWLVDRIELGPRSDALFVNLRGARLSRQAVFEIVRANAIRAGLEPARVSPHVLRHSAATHMIEAGADLRVVQELLGHANVKTTQIYTRVSAHHLREIYFEAHPRSR
jgi:integrase/recombinase XerD